MVEAAPATLRKAKMADAPAIQRLITRFAARDEMLHRSLGEVYESIRNFFVVEEAGEPRLGGEGDSGGGRAPGSIVACGALQISWGDLAEVKSLAVSEEHQGRGHGKRIVLACLEEGRALGLATIFALTYKPGFFEKLGFRVVDKATLPHKVWTECIRCPKFPDCGEIAVVRDLVE
jgi:amino-acid N-acetyltransferase